MKNFLLDCKDKIFDIFEYYREHWIRYVIILLTFIISCFLLVIFTRDYTIIKQTIYLQNIYENNIVVNQQLYLFGISINIWLAFITAISIIIGAFFALFQYDKNKKQKQQEKGSEISYRFSDKIALKLSIICGILRNESFINENILSLDPFALKEFDCDEVKTKFKKTNKKIKEYEKLIDSKAIQEKYYIYLNNALSNNDKENFPKTFHLLIDTTLNELESICMDISSTIAGSQFIYPSLHQLFLDTIHILYLHISSINKTNKILIDKYYTNIIFVYNDWNKIRKKDINKKKKIDIKIKQINKQKARKINKAKKNKPKRV